MNRNREGKAMSEKNVVKVVIDGKTIRLGGFESTEYLEHVAFYINHKIAEMHEMPGYSRQQSETKSILLALNIADDYYKAKMRVDSLEKDVEDKDAESYRTKQDLVNAQVKIRQLEKEVMSLQKLLAEGAGQPEKEQEVQQDFRAGEKFGEDQADKAKTEEVKTEEAEPEEVKTKVTQEENTKETIETEADEKVGLEDVLSQLQEAEEPRQKEAEEYRNDLLKGAVPVMHEMSTAEQLAAYVARKNGMMPKSMHEQKKEALFGKASRRKS
jgi:cell division protein ZapA